MTEFLRIGVKKFPRFFFYSRIFYRSPSSVLKFLYCWLVYNCIYLKKISNFSHFINTIKILRARKPEQITLTNNDRFSLKLRMNARDLEKKRDRGVGKRVSINQLRRSKIASLEDARNLEGRPFVAILINRRGGRTRRRLQTRHPSAPLPPVLRVYMSQFHNASEKDHPRILLGFKAN